jgi:FixJ family two-component response regulator
MSSDTSRPQVVAVVDDDESVRDALSSLLRSLGYAVAVFASAEEFLASPRRGNTGCLIADVRMPGMSGLELQQRLGSNDRRIPTVIITAHADHDAERRAVAAGAVAFLRKPFQELALIDAVRSALASTVLS